MAQRCLAIIPARGGSKGLPKKNIKPFAGKPLIQWAIECALKAKSVSTVVVSTDSDEIEEISHKLDVQVVRRPAELATDTALVINAIKYTIGFLKKEGKEFDNICLLEPTSPFRSAELVDQCIERLQESRFSSVATFSEAPVSPNRLWKIENEQASYYIDDAVPWLLRQKQPKAYVLNGMVYAFRQSTLSGDDKQISILTKDVCPIVVNDRPGIDIDSEDEFIAAEVLFKRRWHENT